MGWHALVVERKTPGGKDCESRSSVAVGRMNQSEGRIESTSLSMLLVAICRSERLTARATVERDLTDVEGKRAKVEKERLSGQSQVSRILWSRTMRRSCRRTSM